MSLHADGAAVHPIGVVARRTGLSLHVLRAWERRHGVVEPGRTRGGQRLYSDADIERLTLLRRVTEAGHNISQVAALDILALRDLLRGDVPVTVAAGAAVVPDAAASGFVEAALEAAARMDGGAVHGILMRAVVGLRPGEFLDTVLVPLLHDVGQRWHTGEMSPAHEHVVSSAARRVLTWLLDAYDAPSDAPLLVATTPAGEQHEFGAMVVSAVALEEGWRVEYLGTSLPADEVVRVVQVTRASAVALSVVNRGLADVAAQVQRVRRRLPSHIPVIAGGAAAAVQRDALEAVGALVITELDVLRSELRRRGGTNG